MEIAGFRIGLRLDGRAGHLALFLCVALSHASVVAPAPAAEQNEIEPPVANRPTNFSGAIGWGFRIQMRASPTELQAEEPILLTVTITGAGNMEQIQRPDLRRLPRFADQFQIENLPDRYLAATKTREFDYRLRPRTAAVKEVPLLRFVYYNPKILPAESGYQTAVAPPIPLTVKSRTQVSPALVEGPRWQRGTPESVFQITEGPAVLRSESPYALLESWELAGLLVGPPLLGSLWCLYFRRRYPDVTTQLRKRRSRAAQHTLRAIRRLSRLDTPAQAQQAAAILAEYLRHRLDLRTMEPTPAELARQLEQLGSNPVLAQSVACFYGEFDAVRFAPELTHEAKDWPAAATRLVYALEEETWPSHS
ncbi:MAG TPA: BatD family protein [Gemmataceae bacterium]|nr:BatD family protein [Gemmataceae bacterium]